MGARSSSGQDRGPTSRGITTAHGMSGPRALPLERQREPPTRQFTRDEGGCCLCRCSVGSTGLKITNYDVALVDQAGVVLTERRIDDNAIGYQLLLALLAEHGDDQVEPIPVAIDTPRGLVVACLRRTGRQVCAINPLSVARYRERHSVARTKSERVDA